MVKVKKKVKKESVPIANRACCNPFKEHKKVLNGLRNITEDIVTKSKAVKIHLPLNRKICNKCFCKVKYAWNKGPASSPGSSWKETDNSPITSASALSPSDQRKHNLRRKRLQMVKTQQNVKDALGTSTSPSAEEKTDSSMSEIIDIPLAKKQLNQLMLSIGLEKLDEKSMRSEKYKKYKQETLTKIHNALSKYVFDGTEIENNEIIDQFKTKFAESNGRREKIAILSCLPISWNAHKLSEEFNVSYHMAVTTKNQVKTNGILFNISKKVGVRTIPDETIELVKSFYRSDEISRACPGMRDYIVQQENGDKTAIQRRMLLVNLNEAYQLFKANNIDVKMGFSKFAAIRPPECVLALEKYGTHTTCVCSYHQNVKLTIDSLKRNGLCTNIPSYREMIEIMMCDPENRSNECYLNLCENCPGKADMISMLLTQLENSMFEEFRCKQWVNMRGRFTYK